MTHPGPTLAEIRADARSAVDRYWSDRRAAAAQAMAESIDAALRARLYHRLRLRLIEGPPITFPTTDQLRSDMTAFTLAPSFACPYCGAVSHNRKDVEHRYCGRCHVFVDDGPPPVRGTDTFDEATARPPMYFYRDERLNAIANWQMRGDYQATREATLAVLLAPRADKTAGEPPDWPMEVLWCWRYLALKAVHEAMFVGRARGGFLPNPVRWISLCWPEPEPRRSRMLGITAPWRPGHQAQPTPWELD